MLDLTRILIDGAILSGLASLILLGTLWLNPRIFLQDYPDDVKAQAPPKTPQEKRLSLLLGIPFLLLLAAVPLISTLALKAEGVSGFAELFLNAFGVALVFNLVDWLILDWLLFCTLTPSFLVIPGTEGMAGYKDYGYHFRGFLTGCLFSAAAGIIIAAIAYWMPL